MSNETVEEKPDSSDTPKLTYADYRDLVKGFVGEDGRCIYCGQYVGLYHAVVKEGRKYKRCIEFGFTTRVYEAQSEATDGN